MAKEELYDKIEAYLKNHLSSEERQSFEQEIKGDDTLAKEVKLHSSLIKATGEKEIIALRSQLDDIFQELETSPNLEEEKKNNNFLSWLLRLGGAILLLLAIIYLILPEGSPLNNTSVENTPVEQAPNLSQEASGVQQEQKVETPTSDHGNVKPPVKDDPPETSVNKINPLPQAIRDKPASSEIVENRLAIAMANYELPDGNILIRKSSNPSELDVGLSPLERAKIAFSQGIREKDSQSGQENEYFADAVTILDSLVEKQDLRAQFIRAHAHFQLGQYKAAGNDFEKAIDDRRYKEQSEWGLILSLYAQGLEYQERLDKIISDTYHTYHKNAISLEEQIVDLK